MPSSRGSSARRLVRPSTVIGGLFLLVIVLGLLAIALFLGTQNRFVAHLRLITSGFSLGHDDSLIVHTAADGPRTATYPEEFRQYGHLRLSVGLEDPDDLLADLAAALEASEV